MPTTAARVPIPIPHFAPFDNPEIIATCVIEQGNSGTDAGYTVKDVFDCYFGIGKYEKEDSSSD